MLLLATGSVLFAQNQTTQIEMPQMPEMPSMPTVGGSFYTPSFPTRPNSVTSKNTTTETGKEKNESVLTEALTPESILTSNLSKGNVLTAYDISSLYDSGLFSNLSSLDTTSSLSTYNTNSSTNVLLQQVLNGLNDLKKQQQNASAKEKNELNATKTDSENFKKREPSILRFKVNGFNIADSLTKVFFSETEPDGTFLLTGDRRYFVNQQPRTETFYMLFKTIGSNGSTLTYRVQPTLVQDYKNENSYVYKLAAVKNLTAEKTGNLVVIHYSGDSVNADLLLDIDSN
jgi:hypothetical protein